MERVVLKAAKRTVVGKQVSVLRREGYLPGVIYGYKVDSTPIQMDSREANLTIPKLTSSSIVTIDLDGKKISALVRERQKDYIKGHLTHVDFQAVSMTEKIDAMVAIHLHGVAPAVNKYNAVIVTSLNELAVQALPQDLPERIELDISVLTEIGNAIYVRDISLPAEVEVLADPDEVIVIATGTALEPEEVETEAEGAEPELIEKEKEDEAE
ncbi:MAG: 50S ribosomal protein L25 [Anaerolineales bacterium]|jgi:large subunit ribosomal protein L25|nr:50S ribosomal protein L25 [Anaerolineales bacterium]